MDEQAAVLVTLGRRIGTRRDRARVQELFETVFSELAQTALGVALGAMDLGGVDAKQPITLMSGVNCIAVDHRDAGGDGRDGLSRMGLPV